MLHFRHMMRFNGRPTMENANYIGHMIGIEKRETKLRKTK